MTTRQTPVNALTVDVEDYFKVSAFENVISRAPWDSMTVRVRDNTHRSFGPRVVLGSAR